MIEVEVEVEVEVGVGDGVVAEVVVACWLRRGVAVLATVHGRRQAASARPWLSRGRTSLVCRPIPIEAHHVSSGAAA